MTDSEIASDRKFVSFPVLVLLLIPVLFATIVWLTLSVANDSPDPQSRTYSCEPPLLIGHRGSKTLAPENTLPAFRNAIELGGDGVEIDVRLTKDLQLVAFHDDELSRTTNDRTGRDLNKLTLEELKKLDAGSWFGQEFVDTRVPTLAEIYEALGPDVVYLFDLKYTNSVSHFAKFFRARKFNNKVIVGSFKQDVLREVKKYLPEVELLYWMTKMRRLNFPKKLGVSYVRVPRLNQHKPELLQLIIKAGFVPVISSSYLTYDVGIAIVNNMKRGLKRRELRKPTTCS